MKRTQQRRLYNPLSDEERAWYTSIACIGFEHREACDLARTAARRMLYRADLTRLRDSHRGPALFGAVRDWIRGRR